VQRPELALAALPYRRPRYVSLYLRLLGGDMREIGPNS